MGSISKRNRSDRSIIIFGLHACLVSPPARLSCVLMVQPRAMRMIEQRSTGCCYGQRNRVRSTDCVEQFSSCATCVRSFICTVQCAQTTVCLHASQHVLKCNQRVSILEDVRRHPCVQRTDKSHQQGSRAVQVFVHRLNPDLYMQQNHRILATDAARPCMHAIWQVWGCLRLLWLRMDLIE